MSTAPIRPDHAYIDFDPYFDECEVRCKTVKLVVTRKPHFCFCGGGGQGHQMPAGTRARYERANVEGVWSSYYSCIPCLENWLRHTDPLTEEDEDHEPHPCAVCEAALQAVAA